MNSKPINEANGNYADINGISMYYEVHGTGEPIVLIHGGGSTIYTTFGTILPMLAKKYKVIAVELQAHGHTSDRPAPQSFEQDADDVAKLLTHINVSSAHIFGFSNGGNTAMQLAIRHPGNVRKLILASAFYKRQGMEPGFWEGMNKATFGDMPQPYKDEFLKIKNNPAALLNMFHKDVARMQTFSDWDENVIAAIQAPALVASADQDVILAEHAVQMHRLLPNSRLAILPGKHGSYLGELLFTAIPSQVPALFAAIVEEFLSETNPF